MNFPELKNLSRHQQLMLLGFGIGLVVMIWYLSSGQGNIDQSLVKLQGPQSNVLDVNIENTLNGSKTINVQCADGSSYDVYLPAGESDSTAIKNNRCKQ